MDTECCLEIVTARLFRKQETDLHIFPNKQNLHIRS